MMQTNSIGRRRRPGRELVPGLVGLATSAEAEAWTTQRAAEVTRHVPGVDG